MDQRIDKISMYLKLAKDMALRSPCISRRRFGAIIVKDDAIISTGYAGTIRGAINCGVDCTCLKDLWAEEPNKSYEHCSSLHAEMNAIVNAARVGISVIGATMYVAEVNGRSCVPCYLCRRFIVNAGIKDVYDGIDSTNYRHYETEEFIKMENDWIQNQLNTAPKTKVTGDEHIGTCANCGEMKRLITKDNLCEGCIKIHDEGIT